MGMLLLHTLWSVVTVTPSIVNTVIAHIAVLLQSGHCHAYKVSVHAQ